MANTRKGNVMTFRPMATRIRLNLRPQRASILLPIVFVTAPIVALTTNPTPAAAPESSAI